LLLLGVKNFRGISVTVQEDLSAVRKVRKPSREAIRNVPGVSPDTAALREGLRELLAKNYHGMRIGQCKWGVYAFLDYDREPIYVGQTYEGLGARIGRHLTNQRTDAVAMNVLDPFEVAYIRMWPLELSGFSKKKARMRLDSAEYTVYKLLLRESKLNAVLNEKPPPNVPTVKLPKPLEGCVVPERLFKERKHPDVRIARRAATIASLAKVISERSVSRGLRMTMRTQARRLLALAERRLSEVSGHPPDH
jgi:GIY-YIG catalytic domain